MKTQVNLGNIQETQLIFFWATKELERAEPIVIDPKSVEIIEALDYDFDKFYNANNSLVGSCLRRVIIDNWVSNFLKQHPQGTVGETITPPYMLVAEAVLMYLSEQQVKQFFDQLIDNFSDSIFGFDCISPLMVKNQHHDSIKYISANFDWSIPLSVVRKGAGELGFSLINRLLFKYIPLLRNTYRLSLFQLA